MPTSRLDKIAAHKAEPLFHPRWLEIRKNWAEYMMADMPSIRDDTEFEEFVKWHKTLLQHESLQPLKRVKFPAADGKVWLAERADGDTPDNSLEALYRADANFWMIIGMQITKQVPGKPDEPFVYNQPVKKALQREVDLRIGGNKEFLPINGILVIIQDELGNYLMSAGQGTTADTENQLLIRMAGVISAGKYAIMLNPQSEAEKKMVDPALKYLCEALGITPDKFLAMAEEVFIPPVDDPNADIKNNIGVFITIPTGDPRHEKLAANGMNRWCTRNQVDMIFEAGLADNHTIALFMQKEARERLKRRYVKT